MIDSNNVDIIRKNIRELNHAVNPERIDDIEYQVGELENVVGGVTLPEGKTITSILSTIKYDNIKGVNFRITETGSSTTFIIYGFLTDELVTSDCVQIQFRANHDTIRYVVIIDGTILYDKSVTLS